MVKERIFLLYKENKTWEVYMSGAYLFNCDSAEAMLEKLAKLIDILE